MNITPIIEAAATLIAAIITAVVVPYIRSKTTAAQQKEIATLVQIAVTAAEQLYNQSGKGKEKKAYVLNWLSERGVIVDEKELDAMIEAAVFELPKKLASSKQPGKHRHQERMVHMSYTNSPLAGYTKLSKNRTSPRNHAIDTITIHCVVGQWTAKQTCDYFAGTGRQASCNYAVGKDGSIGLCVEEKDRSWCSSSAENDNRAVTIEVASDTTHPYAVTDAAYKALIELVADICRRNGIKKLIWSTDKNVRIKHLNGANMTVHRDFARKACPGDYLYNRHGDIASKVNAKLGTSSAPAQSVPASGTALIGKAKIPASRLAAFLLSKNSAPKLNGVNAEQLAQLYISEGEAEGVRGDLAFCQSCLETGYWKFKGGVKPSQNNFSGIGATGNGAQGASFPDAKTGIRAQIQHLKAYATKEALRNECVDPRYNLVAKGCAPTIEGLSGRWAADKGYAEKILSVYKEAASFKDGTVAKFPYLVKVTADALNVRSGPGTSYKVNMTIRDQGTYTIVEEKNGWGGGLRAAPDGSA